MSQKDERVCPGAWLRRRRGMFSCVWSETALHRRAAQRLGWRLATGDARLAAGGRREGREGRRQRRIKGVRCLTVLYGWSVRQSDV